MTYLEPVDGATIDEGWEHAKTVAERITNWAEGKDQMKVAAYPLDKFVVHVHRSQFHLRVLLLSKDLHLRHQLNTI